VTVRVADVDGPQASAQVDLVPFGTAAGISGVARAFSAAAPSRIEIFGHTGFVNPGGTTGVFLGCFGATECAGAMTLTAGGTVVGGRGAFYVSPNDGGIVYVTLRANGLRLLAERHKLMVTVSVADSVGGRTAAGVTLVPYFGDIDDYALVTSPTTVAPGSPATFDLALTNASSPGLTLGSARFVAPSGFKVRQASLPRGAHGEVTVARNTIELRNLLLAQNATLHVRVAATAPARCKITSSAWGSAAWEGRDFNVQSLNRESSRSTARSMVSGPCGLRFVTEPAGAAVNEHITGAGADPSGRPVSVEVVDGGGNVVASSTASITIAVRDNPGNALLGGTTTVRAVHGVARFGDLTLSKPWDGYRLRAASQKLPAATSKPFGVSSTTTTCTQDQSCQTTLSTAASDFQVTAQADPSKPNAGTLSESVDVGTPLQCPGYAQLDPNWWEFSMSSANRSKTILNTLKVPLLPLSGPLDAILNLTQACLGTTAEFTTKSGQPAPAGTLPDGSSGFIGLLPDCPGPANDPCVVSRQTGLDLSNGIGFDIVLTLYIPEGFAGDPWFRA
jgi:hypothetical protein